MNADIEILYEDDVLLAVNKPPRLPVHGTRDPRRSNLQDLLERRRGRKLVLFHRLDADTTGVLLLGKSRAINAAMSEVFARHRIRKTYWAVVRGRWRSAWSRIESEIRRRETNREAAAHMALTTFRVLAANAERSLLEVLPKTGRTHQIRLHCASKGCPILGDPEHDPIASEVPLALHARRLDFRHPLTGTAVRIVAEPPGYWQEVWLAGLTVEV